MEMVQPVLPLMGETGGGKCQLRPQAASPGQGCGTQPAGTQAYGLVSPAAPWHLRCAPAVAGPETSLLAALLCLSRMSFL